MMKTFEANIIFDKGTFILSGRIHYGNVVAVYEKSLVYLTSLKSRLENNPLIFDFSNVKTSDSAGLSLIIEWIKYGRIKGLTILFKNISGEIMAIAKAANLDGIIPIIL